MKGEFKLIVFILIGALFLIIDAFYNGFPIVYSDTSTYIASGLELQTPFDRPITYGLFLRLFSLNGLSLWFVIFFQGLILSYLIFLLVRQVIGEKLFLPFGLLTIIFLSFFTGLSWTVSQLMPDIFTSIALLCLILILLGAVKRRTLFFLYSLFFISVAMHMSHILLFSLILVSAFVLRNFILQKQNYPKATLRIMILFLLTIASIVTMGSALSKSKHVFFMGTMVDKGILKKYLDENCATYKYKLCTYKDSLPTTALDFIWKENSPLYKIGWKESKEEFNEIIYATLTQPKYIIMHIKGSIKATLQQLIHFNIGDGNGSFLEGTRLYERVFKYFNNDLHNYTLSRQNQSQLKAIDFFNVLFIVITILCLCLLVFLIIVKHSIIGKLKAIMILVFISILLNAWDCGTFSMAIDRLGCKLIWLIPFITLIALYKAFHKKRLRTLETA
jgi:hypothetical protein